MDFKKVIEDEFVERAKETGFSYDELHVDQNGDDYVITVSKTIGGVLCKSGLQSGNINPVTTPEYAKKLARLAVDRQNQFWPRIEQEYREDFALLAGANPTLNPNHRITRPGHYTESGKFTAPAL
jgi:hypothetical protein